MSHAALLAIFLLSAAVTWAAGIWLTRVTDALDTKYKLGSAFGGLLILGIVTSLPEIAVVITAALQKHYGIIIGTLIGGIAIQTAIISIFDFRAGRRDPLTFSAASLTLVLEAAFVILVTVGALMAIRTPIVIPHTSVSIASILIFVLWVSGLWLVYRARKGLPWRAEALDARPGRKHHERRQIINHPSLKTASLTKIYLVLFLASLATLAAGVGLASTGNRLAATYHIGSGLFAATFIALAGALPNISTGVSSIKIGDYQLAMSDIFGGNSFMPALFVICDLITGNSVLRNATPSDVWFAALGVLLTTIYLIGLIVRPRRTHFRLGLDSVIVVVLYIAAVIVLSVNGG